MALVEQRPDRTSRPRLGSRGSPCSEGPESPPTPAPARRAQASEAAEATSAKLRRFADGPYGRLLAKSAGISALMLGLAGVGALAMAQGLRPRHAPDDARTTPMPRAPAPAAAQALPALPSLAAPPSGADPGRAPVTSPAEVAPVPSGMTPDGKVILNLAGVTELRTLPGIGQKRAEAIVQLRLKLGKFKRVTDLLRVKGIGPKRLKQLLPKLVLD
jgi:competence protein ComEA